MKFTPPILCLGILLAGHCLWAQQPPGDMLADQLFPPELLVHFHSEIGLDAKQTESIVAGIQEFHAQSEAKQKQLHQEAAKLAGLLKVERVENDAALAQFDKILNLEREIRRAHMAFVIGLKNKLSLEQQKKLQEIKKLHASGKLLSSLHTKMEAKLQEVQAGVEKWQNDGRDPSAIAETMQEFEPLMKAGKLRDAEALLDRALKHLSGDAKEK
jgi:hypothetical protein